jgi:hypothetical protein
MQYESSFTNIITKGSRVFKIWFRVGSDLDGKPLRIIK